MEPNETVKPQWPASGREEPPQEAQEELEIQDEDEDE